jgi:hypothetical protein
MFEDKEYEIEDGKHQFEIVRKGIDGWLSMRLDAVSMLFVFFAYLY